jgi:hypothetical protein
MLLKDLTISDEKKLAKINKALKEAFGFTLASKIESGKLQTLYTKVADDLYNLKLNLGDAKDKDYAKKLLVKEGLAILVRKDKTLQEGLLNGPGANAYERVIAWLTDYVNNACEVGDEYEEAIYEAMKHYRSSKYRFNDAMVEQDLRNSTAHCADAPAELVPESVQVSEDPGHSILDIITPEELERLRGYVADTGPNQFYEDEVLFDKLYTYYIENGEMPYGVAKARTGTPDEWILNQVQVEYGDEVSGLEEGGRNPDRHADREWMDQVSRETAASKKKVPGARGGENLSLASDDYQDDTNDYYSYMSKKTTRKNEMKEGYVKQLRRLLEAEVEQAESLIAAKGFSQELQDMVEKLGRLVNEDLPAVVEQMRDAYGSDVATGFENSASQTLSSVMDSLKTSKQEIDNSVDSIATGQAPAATGDMESPELNGAEGDLEVGLGGEEDLDLDLDADLDLGDEEGLEMGDELDIEEPLGRAQKESVDKKAALKKRINETRAKIARLTVAKKKAKK